MKVNRTQSNNSKTLERTSCELHITTPMYNNSNKSVMQHYKGNKMTFLSKPLGIATQCHLVFDCRNKSSHLTMAAYTNRWSLKSWTIPLKLISKVDLVDMVKLLVSDCVSAMLQLQCVCCLVIPLKPQTMNKIDYILIHFNQLPSMLPIQGPCTLCTLCTGPLLLCCYFQRNINLCKCLSCGVARYCRYGFLVSDWDHIQQGWGRIVLVANCDAFHSFPFLDGKCCLISAKPSPSWIPLSHLLSL